MNADTLVLSFLLAAATLIADKSVRVPSTGDLDLIILDHRISQYIFADAVGGLTSLGLRNTIGKCDLEVLPLADVVDAFVAEKLDGMVDGLALRVEDAGLEGDKYFGFHNC